jgi:hypothetical protein
MPRASAIPRKASLHLEPRRIPDDQIFDETCDAHVNSAPRPMIFVQERSTCSYTEENMSGRVMICSYLGREGDTLLASRPLLSEVRSCDISKPAMLEVASTP